MVREDAAQYIDEAVAAIRTGDRSSARVALARALTCDPQSEMAWLWMSGIVDSPAEQLVILQRILEINPASRLADQGVRLLREQRPELFAPPPPKRGTGRLTPPPPAGTGTLKRITQPLTNAVLAPHSGQTLSATLAAAEAPATMKRITQPLTPAKLGPHPGQTLSATLAAALAEAPATMKRITQPLTNAMLPAHPGLLPHGFPGGPPPPGSGSSGGPAAPPSAGNGGPAEPDLLAALLATHPAEPPAAPPRNGNGNGNGGLPAAARRLADESLSAHGAALLADVLPPLSAARRLADESLSAHGAALLADVLPPAPARPALELIDLRLADEPNPERLPPYPGMRVRLGAIGPAPTSTGKTMLLSAAPAPPALRHSTLLSAWQPATATTATPPAARSAALLDPAQARLAERPLRQAERTPPASAAPLASAPAVVAEMYAPWLPADSPWPLLDRSAVATAAPALDAPRLADLLQPVAGAAAESVAAASLRAAAATPGAPELLPTLAAAPAEMAPPAVSSSPERAGGLAAAASVSGAAPAVALARPAPGRHGAPAPRAVDPTISRLTPPALPPRVAGSLALAAQQAPQPRRWIGPGQPAFRLVEPAIAAPIAREHIDVGALALAVSPRWVALQRQAILAASTPPVAAGLAASAVSAALSAVSAVAWLAAGTAPFAPAARAVAASAAVSAVPAALRLAAGAAVRVPSAPTARAAAASAAVSAVPAALRLAAGAATRSASAPSARAVAAAAVSAVPGAARQAAVAAQSAAGGLALGREVPAARQGAAPAAAAARLRTPVPAVANPIAPAPVTEVAAWSGAAAVAPTIAALPGLARGAAPAVMVAAALAAERVLPLLDWVPPAGERTAPPIASAARIESPAAERIVAAISAARIESPAAERIVAAISATAWPSAAKLDRPAAGPALAVAPAIAADLPPALIAAPLPELAAQPPVASAASSAGLLNFLGELPAPAALAGAAELAAPLAIAPPAAALGLAPAAAALPETITLPGLRPLPAARGLSVGLLWMYLGLITLGELLTAAVAPGLIAPIASVQIGLALHATVLIALVAQGSLSNDEQERKLCLGLTLAPLIRLLSLSLPLTIVPQITWYPLVSIPLLMATWLISRQLKLPARDIGLGRGNLRAQMMLVGMGFGLGALEFLILKPKPILADFSAQSVVLTAVVLTIFTGFTEELIFRGLLQHLATPVLKRTAGLMYVALLFGVLHIGYQSLLDVVFVFLVGVVFAYIVDWSKSILGVTLAHGLTNVNLFLVMPLFGSQVGDPAAPITWIVGIGTLVSLGGMWIVWRQSLGLPAAADGLPLPHLRLVRESRRLSRGDLARQAGLTVRALADLERGRLASSPEQLARLAGALDSPPHALTGPGAADEVPPALPAE